MTTAFQGLTTQEIRQVSEYGEVTDGRANEARQAINRAKWVMFTYAMEDK